MFQELKARLKTSSFLPPLIFFVLIAIFPLKSATAIENSNKFKDPALEKVAREIYAEVMSPYCPGRLLQDCPSSDAAKLRISIYEKLESGQSAEQVTDYLLSVYGESMRAAPLKSGFGIFAWITPFALLLLGLGIVYYWLQNKRNLEENLLLDSKENNTVDAKMQKQIQDELDRS